MPNAIRTIASEAGPQFTSENVVPSIWVLNGTPSTSDVSVAQLLSWAAAPPPAVARNASKLVIRRRGGPLARTSSPVVGVRVPDGVSGGVGEALAKISPDDPRSSGPGEATPMAGKIADGAPPDGLV